MWPPIDALLGVSHHLSDVKGWGGGEKRQSRKKEGRGEVEGKDLTAACGKSFFFFFVVVVLFLTAAFGDRTCMDVGP